jgi:hypothetical protein
MYNTELVIELLKTVGFKQVESAVLDDLPLMNYIEPSRAKESSYVVARCASAEL